MSLKLWIEHCTKTDTYTVRWRDANGKKHRDSYIWETKRDANKRKDVLEQQDRNSALGIYKEIGFSEAADVFLRLHGPRLANDESRHIYRNQLSMLKKKWGDRPLSSITYQDVAAYWQDWIKRNRKVSTANKHIMLMHCLYERFKFWNGMVPEVMPEKVALPEINPVAVAKEYLGRRRMSTTFLNRKRRVSEEELHTAKLWCLKNDPELWDAIKLAVWTALRKDDLKKLRNGFQVNLIQEKTGQEQIMPIPLRNVPEFGNLQFRWNCLRGAMGWLKKDTPLHTTWHDLRHCAPSMLADEGFEPAIIAQYLGHTNTKMSRTYTHPTGKALIPAIEFIEKKLEEL